MTKTPIPFCSFGGYRWFCSYWWKDLWRYVTYGWWRDIQSYWLRARYGWAPRDTWNLDHYLNSVMGGTLRYLADHNCGAPYGYPNLKPEGLDVDTAFAQWDADLRRWADAFDAAIREDDLPEDYPADYEEERRRAEAVKKALAEMIPWWEGLWD